MDDRELIAGLTERDDAVLRELEKTYGGYCYAVAYNVLGSREDAEETVNDAMNAAWRAIPPAQPLSLRAYLGKLTRNLALKRVRFDAAQKRGGGESAAVYAAAYAFLLLTRLSAMARPRYASAYCASKSSARLKKASASSHFPSSSARFPRWSRASLFGLLSTCTLPVTSTAPSTLTVPVISWSLDFAQAVSNSMPQFSHSKIPPGLPISFPPQISHCSLAAMVSSPLSV